MKKTLAVLLTTVTAAGLLLAGCGAPSGASSTPAPGASGGVVNVYNWGVYIDESVLDDFILLRYGQMLLHAPVAYVREKGTTLDAFFREEFRC